MDSPTKRRDLEADKRHMDQLQPGGYLIYQRPADLAVGSWLARWYNAESRKQKQVRIGMADDLTSADGVSVFSYEQAKGKAIAWFKEAALKAEIALTGISLPKGPYTVADAISDYLATLRRDGKNSADNFEIMARAHILPELGDIRVVRLTRERLDAWRTELAKTPRRRTRKVDGVPTVAFGKAPVTEDEIRARKDSANHMLIILKTALKLALKNGRIPASGPGGWADATGFKGVHGVRMRFLSRDEQQRLVKACDPEFRTLVMAGLYTGGRYGELARLLAQDFNAKTGTVHFGPFGKVKGKTRHVILTEEARAWFQKQVEGKSPSDLLFTRSAQRWASTLASGKAKADRWTDTDQCYYMKKACTAAKITPPITFHGLRHTYASGLVNAGVPLVFVAEQLGHNGIAMVERYYGHLAPSAMAECIRKSAPVLSLEAGPRPVAEARGNPSKRAKT